MKISKRMPHRLFTRHLRVSLRGKKIGSSHASSQRTSHVSTSPGIRGTSRKRKKEIYVFMNDIQLIIKRVGKRSIIFYIALTYGACSQKIAELRVNRCENKMK